MNTVANICIGSSAPPLNGEKPGIVRRAADFHPNVWGDYFIKISQDEKKLTAWSKRSIELKEEVLKMLSNIKGPAKLDLIDTLYHLGISYHFEDEIEEALEKIYSTYTDDAAEDNLYTLALRFRLLRKNGFNASSHILNKFKGVNGSFEEKLASDIMGLLSLYEASFVGTKEDQILDEAIAFTTTHLRAALTHMDSLLAERVAHSLELPLHKRLQRLEARYFISLYEQDKAHNTFLLEFAKLDYNTLQALHQREMKDLTNWWKEMNLVGKMTFARDRVTEISFFILGAYFEPQYSRARMFSSKILAIFSVVDDLYDVYGTLEELQVFTDAIYRWDTVAMENLPEYTKPLYEALIDCLKEFEVELTPEGNTYRVEYLKTAVQDMCRVYFIEATWFYGGHVPKVEEYMHAAEISCGYPMLFIAVFVGAGEFAMKEVFEWIKSYPKYVQVVARLCRIIDDVKSNKFEQLRGHVASIVECYVNEHKCSEEEALENLHQSVAHAWKDINQACLKPTPFSMAVMMRIFNLSCVMEVLYQFGDGYTFSDGLTKERLTALLKDPILI